MISQILFIAGLLFLGAAAIRIKPRNEEIRAQDVADIKRAIISLACFLGSIAAQHPKISHWIG